MDKQYYIKSEQTRHQDVFGGSMLEALGWEFSDDNNEAWYWLDEKYYATAYKDADETLVVHICYGHDNWYRYTGPFIFNGADEVLRWIEQIDYINLPYLTLTYPI